MMKLIWTLCIVWSLCYAAEALQCYSCSNAACTTTSLETCSANQRCLSGKLDSTVGGTGIVVKKCVADSVCLTTGTKTISANLGLGTGIASVHCCNTDRCNQNTPSVPSASQQPSNGLKCFTCDLTATKCNISLNCVGLQDRCGNGTVSTNPARKAFGCVSSNFCGSSALLSVFPPLASLASFSEGPKCCEGNCCNAASELKMAVVPLLLWIVTVTLSS